MMTGFEITVIALLVVIVARSGGEATKTEESDFSMKSERDHNLDSLKSDYKMFEHKQSQIETGIEKLESSQKRLELALFEATAQIQRKPS